MAERKNAEGYNDPTPYKAESHIEKVEREKEEQTERKAKNLIGSIRLLCDLTGFELTDRIRLRHKETGKEFR